MKTKIKTISPDQNIIEHESGLKTVKINSEIQKYFDTANYMAVKEVERLARFVLSSNPNELLSFMMCMGSFFFNDNNDEIIHTCIGGNEDYLKSLVGYNQLVEFIYKWDDYFGLTGTPMTFTATGQTITDW